MYGQSRGAPRGLINCLNNSSLLHDLAAHPQELRRNPPEAKRRGRNCVILRPVSARPRAKLIQGRSARTTAAKLTSKTARLVAGRFRWD
jgi:hypothetical protein